jgi:hypothetical protein
MRPLNLPAILGAATLFVAALPGCNGEEIVDEPPVEEPTPTLTASVDTPSIALGDTFTLTVAVTDFVLDAENVGGSHAPGHGHYHLYLNEVGPAYEIGSGGYAETPRQFTLPAEAPLGSQDLVVVLHYNDHTPLSPPLSYTIPIIVWTPVAPEYTVELEGRVTKLGAILAGTPEYVGEASVLAHGVYPVQSTLSEVTPTLGGYRLEVPMNGLVLIRAYKSGYHPTYTEIAVADRDIPNRRIHLTETDWLGGIAYHHGVDLDASFPCNGPALQATQTCTYAAIVGRILDDGTAGNGNHLPVAGITAEDFLLTGGPDQQAWYTRGPYFLNPDGTTRDDQYSVVDGGRGGLFVAFVEIPSDGPDYRTVRVSVAYEAGTGYRYFGPNSVQVFRPSAVTWTEIHETGIPVAPPVEDVDFDTQVYPLFLGVAQGGLGCQGCHAGADAAGGLDLYGADTAYASLDPASYPERVNLAYPDESHLLRRPLYGDDLPHPIFAFTSPEDAAYQTIRQWIAEGAVREVVQEPASFQYDVYPLLARPATEGGAGCYACHVDGVNAQTAPGGLYFGGGYDAVHDALTQAPALDIDDLGEAYRINKAGYPDRSLVLVKPLYGSPADHPVKIFSDNADPRYVTIYRWIAEGWVNDYGD